ncbi:flavin monoamine oxidase family protein [Rubrolithibacter danxiaensis]|uniref:flavin monoamine oxidase family protein n=1 Tax=Rubrolithibacter danxiaensis TaxID=3390805 RepID=UPI003BF84E24
MKDLQRREFIKKSLIAGIGTSLIPGILQAEDDTTLPKEAGNELYRKSVNSKKIIVAGAGITGLCCAYELMKSGHEVTVLEASGRHGGHVYTGRDGLSEGLYADYGADHITKPGYERFFEYAQEFNLTILPYPHAEGSEAAPGRNGLKMIDGKFYTDEVLADPAILKKFGFNDREVKFLSENPWYALRSLFLKPYLGKFKDEYQPFGIGYDDLDKISIADIYKKEGASPAALRFLGGKNTSALYVLWRLAIMHFRGIPLSEGETFHLKGGNQELPTAFAKKLGSRVKLAHPIQSINHNENGVTVTYKAYGFDEPKEMNADFLVNCITLPVFKNIPVTPALSPQKQYVVDNMSYSSHPFYVFEASSKFWLDDGFKSINMEFEHPDISSIWQETNDVDTSRIILKAYGPGGLSPQRVLAAFRSVYPGKQDTIVQALTVDWTKDKFAPACEMEPFPIGEMHRFWPEILKPEGRIYFAGTYADNLSRGMESCIRSAQRVAKEINQL